MVAIRVALDDHSADEHSFDNNHDGCFGSSADVGSGNDSGADLVV